MVLRKVSELLQPSLLTNGSKHREIVSRFEALPSIRLSKQPATKEAAIIIPVCLVDDKVSLLYTLRSSTMRSHRGMVSFPGGMKDETDISYEACAVRELEEETGIPKELVHVWGCGKAIVPHAGPSITPVIGSVADFSCDKLKPSSMEVEKVFTIAIEELVKPENRGHTQFRSNYSSPVFLHETAAVWGITAFITHMFLIALLPGIVAMFSIHHHLNYNDNNRVFISSLIIVMVGIMVIVKKEIQIKEMPPKKWKVSNAQHATEEQCAA